MLIYCVINFAYNVLQMVVTKHGSATLCVVSSALALPLTNVAFASPLLMGADAEDLTWADGLILGPPENFGYMSGIMKDFFERTFYEVEGKIPPLPFAMFISAENDGTGAELSIERIAKGYPLIKVQPSIINTGEITPDIAMRCEELGTSMAAGLEMGLF